MLQNGVTAARGPRSLAEAPAPAAARPTDAPPETLPGARGDASCPNLPQRPRSNRSAREETLIFRASAHRRSRSGAPLWQIRTHPTPNHPTNPTSTTQNLDTLRITFTARWDSLNAPTGAWCSLTRKDATMLRLAFESQCTYRCVMLPDVRKSDGMPRRG